MSLYIYDEKKKTVRHYCTTTKVNKAIETLLCEMEDMVGSESHEGYKIKVVKDDDEFHARANRLAEPVYIKGCDY